MTRYLDVDKLTIFSHGVEWNIPTENEYDQLAIESLDLMGRKNINKVICNDKNYYNIVSSVLPKSSLIYLPNYVDVNEFKYNELLKKNDDIVVVRNIRPARGIIEAIEGFKTFINSNKSFRGCLQIAGAPIDQSYYTECINLARGYPINFLGHIDQNSVIDLFQRSKISIVPSVTTEGTSLSALESMACGCVCISTSIGGLSDLPSFKIKDLNPQSIARAIDHTINNYSDLQSRQLNMIKTYNFDEWINTMNGCI